MKKILEVVQLENNDLLKSEKSFENEKTDESNERRWRLQSH